MAPASKSTVKVSGKAYVLQVTIGSPPEEIVSFVFVLTGDDRKQYYLQDSGTKTRSNLVSKLLAKLAKVWPDAPIKVEADGNTQMITDVL